MTTILATIIVLGTLIFLHELGHFLAAKLFRVTVEKFSIGFPPTIVSKKLGETEYALGAVPVGGYVKLAGDNPLEDDYVPSDRDLPSKSIAARAVIISAGSIMNLLLALFLFWTVLAFHGMGEISTAPVIGGVFEDAPADSAGLLPGDSVVAVAGVPVEKWGELSKFVHPRAGIVTEFEIIRGDSSFAIALTPAPHSAMTDSGEIQIGLIGIQPSVKYLPMGIFRAIPGAFSIFGEMFLSMGIFIKRLFSSGLEKGDVGGPVLIAKMAGVSAKAGWAALLFFMAALSINLAVLNLFPFPVLDGGHLVYLFIETIRKKPVSIKFKLVAQQVGFLILFALMIYVTVNDIFFVARG
jgi:regulator of sigma E protease